MIGWLPTNQSCRYMDGYLYYPYMVLHCINQYHGGTCCSYDRNQRIFPDCTVLINFYKLQKNIGDGECKTKQTSIAEASQLVFLDRHNIDCDGKYLRDIQLIKDEKVTADYHEIHYKYTCCDACAGNSEGCAAIQSKSFELWSKWYVSVSNLFCR